jgi:2-amino-4-hydroxy-6-hydroxymethyldihydropteridine diphosphokinase
MNSVYLLLESNLEDPKAQLILSHRFIRERIGHVHQQSSLYQTAAWGNNNQPDFLNQVVIIHTAMNASMILSCLLEIEMQMGRVRTEKNAPRIIDLDILFFNNEIIEMPGLTVPHPSLHKRRFTLIPLNEISPEYVHPVLNKSINELLAGCSDSLDVKNFSEVL